MSTAYAAFVEGGTGYLGGALEDGVWSDLCARLTQQFSGVDPDLVRAAVRATRQQFADAPVRLYLHIVAEREACALLTELAGHVPAPRDGM